MLSLSTKLSSALSWTTRSSPPLHIGVGATSISPPLRWQKCRLLSRGISSSCDVEFTHAFPTVKLGTRHNSLPSFLAAIKENQKSNDAETVELSTLIILTNMQRRGILLGRKLRGFGTGKFNGFGGRLESKDIDLTPAHGAQRELREEANIFIPSVDSFKPVGNLTFTFQDNASKMKVHLFHVDVMFQEDASFDSHDTNTRNGIASGVVIDPNTIKGCDEMIPQWFPWSEIPLQQMFMDDSVWLTYFLSSLHGRERGGCHDNKIMKMDGWFHFAPGGDSENQIQHYFLDT